MYAILLWTLLISIVLNGIFFAIAYRLQTDKFTDITYSISFILINLYVYLHSDFNAFVSIASLMITVWTLRLGGFLLYRVVKKGRDRRFDSMRGDFKRFAKFWFGQAIVAWALMIPASMAITGGESFVDFSLLGIFVWLVGLIIESIADYQKYIFRLDSKNKDKWISAGIWKLSRHPNYFGEIMIWLGIYIYVLPALGTPAKFLGLISPVLIIVLLRFGSGIPILEKSADIKWGKNPDYIKYKADTNLLIPLKKITRCP